MIAATLVAVTLTTACSDDKKAPAKAPKQAALPIDTALKSRLQAFAQERRPNGKFGFMVYDLTADKPVYGYNDHLAQPSASCMKLISGVAGLHLLGTDYYYRTSVFTLGTLKQDTLHGDIAFRGSLDPQINAPDLSRFAQELRRKGIKKVTGRVWVDLAISDPVKSEEHWYPWDLSFSNYGLFFKGAPRVVTEWKHALRNAGIGVADSQVVLGRVPRGAHCVFQFRRRIDTVIQRMWKNSSNTQATALLYAIGRKVNPKAEPTAAGVNYLRSFVRDSLGLKDSTLVIHDGCGLCTHNHLTPQALTAVLRYGYQHKEIYRQLNSHLSIAGVDGTARRLLPGESTRGKVRAKTGTLSHPYGISSLAGYVQGNDGHLLAFAIMDSEMSVLDAHVLQRKLCERIVGK
jgi:D-alanyl-D-alanine carboxypeptidase/D-alanyl-D-alanine-endopeptidase (penicillin-binding protein 4)